ncbi:4-hydroxythreonine-4-phosphate dehydrogenase PdxA [Desertihabitans aurantiacus]|uniref:4-hydroxythreonine-4-phosphate dehydrogenase PdxA n=1 Tax=Desertihabitans aurantiacus TaxID=2282477 RepID=UPI000DF7B4B0|nr:4-hydroxythreonine-4-phosphate dehydrogenase PdxA [Desertihabitans aurantiacus]
MSTTDARVDVHHRPTVAVTLGDPAGIGPELVALLLHRPQTTERARVLVLAARAELDAAYRAAGVPPLPLGADGAPGTVVLLDDGTLPAQAAPARTSAEAGARALHQLDRAVGLVRDGRAEAIVFAPLNKTSLHLAGMTEEDELRWFAGRLGHTGPTSELNVLDGLWTARVTSHIPLSAVAERITAERIEVITTLLHEALRDAGHQPRLGVCALNPHNGENGAFGREEIDQIRPGVERARARGIDVSGPFPSDTIFLAARRGDFNGIVTMFHDQGQIAMKLIGFSGGVTVQGGLPVPIATPAHGTAFDIVGRGVADPTSTVNAFDIAVATATAALARATPAT